MDEMRDGVREKHSGEECSDVVVPIQDLLLGSENGKWKIVEQIMQDFICALI